MSSLNKYIDLSKDISLPPIFVEVNNHLEGLANEFPPIVGQTMQDSLQIQSLFTAPVVTPKYTSPYKSMYS